MDLRLPDESRPRKAGEGRDIGNPVHGIVRTMERIQEDGLEARAPGSQNVHRVKVPYVEADLRGQAHAPTGTVENLPVGFLDTLLFGVHDELHQIQEPTVLDDLPHSSIGVGDHSQAVPLVLELP